MYKIGITVTLRTKVRGEEVRQSLETMSLPISRETLEIASNGRNQDRFSQGDRDQKEALAITSNLGMVSERRKEAGHRLNILESAADVSKGNIMPQSSVPPLRSSPSGKFFGSIVSQQQEESEQDKKIKYLKSKSVLRWCKNRVSMLGSSGRILSKPVRLEGGTQE
uniref:Uncharacterized protein n=1 Tax=Ditylenchus dipsaci TaxID=166011 RepID=A0A915CZ41_9BILA